MNNFMKRVAGIACIMICTTTTFAGATFHPGDRGDQIAAIQQALNITADGDYGTGMTQAVKDFQASHGLDADGIVGAETYKAIMGTDMPENHSGHFVQKIFNDSYSTPDSAQTVSTETVTPENAVAVIQKNLAANGYDVSVDGVYGSGTENAVRQFQASHGLTADGVVGSQTFYALTGLQLPTAPVRRFSESPYSSNGYASATAQSVLGIANQFIGVPYVFGGSTPSGFDCSGFTRYVYSSVGIDLPRMADEQYTVGQFVSQSDLQPGDLVFFQTYTSGVSHAGIYIGDNKFISATSSGISIDNLRSGYWSARYVGAKRVL